VDEAMRFELIDRILEVKTGQGLRALKNLTLGEEYLADHFPTFPVMPGVLMLQTLVEAGSWLVRVTEEFQHSVVVLREVKNIKFGNFMEPGRQLSVSVELLEREGSLALFKGKGECEGQSTVQARFVLARYNLSERDPGLAAVDEQLIRHLKQRYAWLTIGQGLMARPAPDGAVASAC
jgi:3-hydroxyacyl-[acyl-carrier-protein] dehydratase